MRIVPPNRVIRSYVQRLDGPSSAVFPLLCPVREAEWIVGWDPRLVVTASGVAERDCVFVTEASPHEAVWYVTRHDDVKWLFADSTFTSNGAGSSAAIGWPTVMRSPSLA